MRKQSNKAAEYKRKVNKAKQEIVQDREPVCQSCGTGQGRLDCSHIISEKRCGDLGLNELRWDKDNIEIECRGCHEVWESGSINDKIKQLNFAKKMQYMKDLDPERYTIRMLAVRSINETLYLQIHGED